MRILNYKYHLIRSISYILTTYIFDLSQISVIIRPDSFKPTKPTQANQTDPPLLRKVYFQHFQ
jgi:hypothetical protein